MISIQYLMARDGELPSTAGLNRFGVPWIPAIIAAGVPCLVLIFMHDVEKLAALYAIGVVGAVAINVTLCAMHPRLRRWRRKIPMFILGMVLLAIWISLGFTSTGADLRGDRDGRRTRPELTKLATRRRAAAPVCSVRPIMEQLTAEALSRPKILLGTYGSDTLAKAALLEAKRSGHCLAVCFIRQVNLPTNMKSQKRSRSTPTRRRFARSASSSKSVTICTCR